MSRIWKQRVFDYVRWAYIDPCDPGRNIYMEMAFSGFYRALLSYAEPGWKDIIDLATGKSWIKHASGLLKDGKAHGAGWVGPTGEILVPLAEAIDRIAWIVMVLELVFEVFIKWGSAAYQVSPCEAEPTYIWWKSHTPELFSSEYDNWTIGPAWAVDAGNIGDFVSSRIDVAPGWEGYVYFAVKVERFLGLGEVTSYSCRVRQEGFGVIKESHYDVRPDPDHKGPIVFVPLTPHLTGRTFIFEVRVEASSHTAEWFAYSGISGGSLRSPDTPFRHSPQIRTGYHHDITSVIDPT